MKTTDEVVNLGVANINFDVLGKLASALTALSVQIAQGGGEIKAGAELMLMEAEKKQ